MTDTQNPGQRAPEPAAAGDDRGTLAWVRQLGAGTLGDRLGLEFVAAAPDRVVARMPVAGNTQPYGLLHGGASAVLAETVGSVAAALHAGPERIAVGLDLNATHHRGVRTGWVTGTATALALGNTLAAYQVDITDEEGRRVCTARLTCLIRSAAPAQP